MYLLPGGGEWRCAIGDQATATGRYAGRKAAEYTATTGVPVVDTKQVEAEKARVYAPVQRKGEIGWKELKAGLGRAMEDYCGEYQKKGTLKMGLDLLKSIRESEAAVVYARNPPQPNTRPPVGKVSSM